MEKRACWCNVLENDHYFHASLVGGKNRIFRMALWNVSFRLPVTVRRSVGSLVWLMLKRMKERLTGEECSEEEKAELSLKVGDMQGLNQANNIDSHCIVNFQLQINVNLTDFSLRYERYLKFCLDWCFCLTACLWGLIAFSSSTENVLNEIILYVSIICRVCWVCKILKKYLKHVNGCMGAKF